MTQTAITETVEKLAKRYGSRNPAVIARDLGIIVVIENLCSIRGYFNSVGRNRFIHINSDCRNRTLVCAHELGHAVLHPDASTHFMRKHTLYSIDRYEKEATYFAACLLISDDDLCEYSHYTYEQLGKVFGVGEAVAKIRAEGI